ncbi:hypothetical protein QQ045_029303 [Rhodiola kirilowii]
MGRQKSSSYSPQTITADETSTVTGPKSQNNSGKAMQNTLLPTTDNIKPRSNIICTYPADDANSPAALINIFASIKVHTAMELHKKLIIKTRQVEPNFRTSSLLDWEPKKDELFRRWDAL